MGSTGLTLTATFSCPHRSVTTPTCAPATASSWWPIDTKYTADPSCSPYNLDNAKTLFQPVYTSVLGQQDSEIRRYTAAITNPANHGKFLEIDVNNPALVSYYVALMAKYHTRGRVSVIP